MRSREGWRATLVLALVVTTAPVNGISRDQYDLCGTEPSTFVSHEDVVIDASLDGRHIAKVEVSETGAILAYVIYPGPVVVFHDWRNGRFDWIEFDERSSAFSTRAPDYPALVFQDSTAHWLSFEGATLHSFTPFSGQTHPRNTSVSSQINAPVQSWTYSGDNFFLIDRDGRLTILNSAGETVASEDLSGHVSRLTASAEQVFVTSTRIEVDENGARVADGGKSTSRVAVYNSNARRVATYPLERSRVVVSAFDTIWAADPAYQQDCYTARSVIGADQTIRFEDGPFRRWRSGAGGDLLAIPNGSELSVLRRTGDGVEARVFRLFESYLDVAIAQQSETIVLSNGSRVVVLEDPWPRRDFPNNRLPEPLRAGGIPE